MCQRLYARIIPCFCGAHKCFGGQSESNPPHQRGRHRRCPDACLLPAEISRSDHRRAARVLSRRRFCRRCGRARHPDDGARQGLCGQSRRAQKADPRGRVRSGTLPRLHGQRHGRPAAPERARAGHQYRAQRLPAGLSRPAVCPRRLRHAQYLGPAPARLPRVRVRPHPPAADRPRL